MYKDKDKQRQSDRIRQQRRRDAKKAKGVTKSGCDERCIGEVRVVGKEQPSPRIAFGCRPTAGQPGYVRPPIPGDEGYIGVCEQVDG